MSAGGIVSFVFVAVIVLVGGLYTLTREAQAELPPSYGQKRHVLNRLIAFIVIWLISFACIGWIFWDTSQ